LQSKAVHDVVGELQSVVRKHGRHEQRRRESVVLKHCTMIVRFVRAQVQHEMASHGVARGIRHNTK
jgi:hypothetical protein